MDFQRFFLLLIFSFSVFLLWDGWQRSQHPELYATPAPAASTPPAAPAASGAAAVPVAASKQSTPEIQVQQQRQSGQKITVKTDVLMAEVNTVGGDLRHLEFVHHRDALDKNKPFTLLQEQKSHTYIAQTGLLGEGLPTHNTVFTAQASEYQLTEGKDTLEVRLTATDVNGAKVAKVFVFHRGSYLVDVGYEVENTGATPISPSAYFQFVRDTTPPEGGSQFVPTYTGPAVFTEQEKFQKVEFSDIDKGKTGYPQKTDNGWIGMLQHFFVAAWLPKEKSQREYYTKQLGGGLYSAGVILPISSIEPGKSAKVSTSLYVGPAQSTLDKIAPGLGLTVDYGWFTIIATPLFWLMSLFHGWVQNWGVAIILLTVIIKLVFFPLSAASYRSMAKMRIVAPKLERIKQQYGDDRERLHKAMMELYQTEKINPLGGCLPVVIQIPVFIALYWAILSSVDLRYAPFFGWITDLSATDPYYVLPIIMGASMIIQTKLNPTPPDPLQAKMMKIMPVVFSVVFFFFPAGLVLYSIVNNVLSILQQWYITRALEAEAKGAAKA